VVFVRHGPNAIHQRVTTYVGHSSSSHLLK
jgi:hypothetical protein